MQKSPRKRVDRFTTFYTSSRHKVTSSFLCLTGPRSGLPENKFEVMIIKLPARVLNTAIPTRGTHGSGTAMLLCHQML